MTVPTDELMATCWTSGLNGIRDLLADNGIVHLELEGIPWWWDEGSHREESDRVRHLLLDAAEVLEPRHLKVTPDGDEGPWEREVWASRFAGLAGQAAAVGARLGIEFFPWSNIKTLHDGLQLVADAGHEAGGVIIDTRPLGCRDPLRPAPRASRR